MPHSLCLYLGRFTRVSFFFFFNDTATTEIYTLSLHDALPILRVEVLWSALVIRPMSSPGSLRGIWLVTARFVTVRCLRDRKSTRLNSSHLVISYAVFCLKKKKDEITEFTRLSLLLRADPFFRY